MNTRLNKSRPVDVRKDEGVLYPNGQFFPTEAFGANAPVDNTRINVPQGSAVISPKSIREANKIARRQKPEITKLNEVLQDPHATRLAKKSAGRRLKALKAEFDPILMAEAASRGGNQVGEDGVVDAAAGMFSALNPLSAGLSLLPAAYNIGMGLFSKVEKLNPESFQNPYESQIRSNMSNRRFNIDPTLEANRTASAGAAYNIRNSGMGGGALAANMLGAQNARMRGDAQAFATKQNQDNQYLQEQSVMDASLGQQRANRNLEVNQINAQAKAAKRNMLAAGLGQVGQFAQNAQGMANQQSRDKQMMGMYRDWMGMLSGSGSGQPLSKLAPAIGGFAPQLNPTLANVKLADTNIDPSSYAWQMQGRELYNY